MYNRIQEAFECIHAEEAMKERTKEYVLQHSQHNVSRRTKKSVSTWLTAACAALLVLGSGSVWFFTPVAAISAEGRNTVELGINALDRVVSVKASGDTPRVKFMNYQEALGCVLAEDEEASAVTVIGDSEDVKAEILEEITSCIHGLGKEIHCAAITTETAAAAHECGIAPGKYESYLAMLEMDETVTAEEVQNMTMSEIRTWLTHHEESHEEEHGTISDGTVEDVEVIEESTQNGSHHGHGAGNGSGHHNTN